MQAHFVGYLLYNCIYLSRVAFSSLFLGIRLATHIEDLVEDIVDFINFQFPFPRDSPCNGFFNVLADEQGDFDFQFPFPRDSPCNSVKYILRLMTAVMAFSSLFLGIRLATWRRQFVRRNIFRAFSSLFLGIRLATLNTDLYGTLIEIFQFPFPRDSPCNSPSEAFILHKSFAKQL